MSPQVREILINHSRTLSYTKDQLIAAQPTDRALHIVLEGAVVVQTYHPVFTEQAATLLLKPAGSLVGAELMFGSDVSPACCVAATRSKVASIGVDRLRHLLETELVGQRPEVVAALALEMSDSFAQMTKRVAELILLPAEDRVLSVLVCLAKAFGTKRNGNWEVEASNEMLQSLAGVAKETLRKAYTSLSNQHLVLKAGRGRLVLMEAAFERAA